MLGRSSVRAVRTFRPKGLFEPHFVGIYFAISSKPKPPPYCDHRQQRDTNFNHQKTYLLVRCSSIVLPCNPSKARWGPPPPKATPNPTLETLSTVMGQNPLKSVEDPHLDGQFPDTFQSKRCFCYVRNRVTRCPKVGPPTSPHPKGSNATST